MSDRRAAFWKDRNVLVTGATGLIGGWLTQALVEAGARVVALERDRAPSAFLRLAGLASRVRLVPGDVTAGDTVARALHEYEVETVFHLAAQSLVGCARRSPVATFEANVRGTWTVLEAARGSPLVGRVIVASSDKAYGPPLSLPYREDAPLRGDAPYDCSKSCADLIAASYHHTYGLPVCITRCANTFGGGDLNFSRLVPDTVRALLLGRPLEIRSDGRFVRDYLYVEDAVDGYLTLAEAMDARLHGQAFNFGSSRPLTVLEMVQQIALASGRTGVDIRVLDQATSEIREQFLDATKAREVLGWTPRTDLAEALRRTIEWYRAYLPRA